MSSLLEPMISIASILHKWGDAKVEPLSRADAKVEPLSRTDCKAKTTEYIVKVGNSSKGGQALAVDKMIEVQQFGWDWEAAHPGKVFFSDA